MRLLDRRHVRSVARLALMMTLAAGTSNVVPGLRASTNAVSLARRWRLSRPTAATTRLG